MNNKIFLNAVDNIDDKLIEEAALYRRSRTPLYLSLSSAAAAVLLLLSRVTFIDGKPYIDISPRIVYTELPDGDAPSGAAQTVAGGGTDGQKLPSDSQIRLTGEAFTPTETTEYLEKNKEHFAELIGLNTELTISLRGYSHIQTDDNTLALDFMTFPVFAENKLVGLIELFRVDGEILYTLSVGGLNWERFDEVFSEHYGERLAFVYSGMTMEYAIAPDDTAYDLRTISDNYKYTVIGEYEKYAAGYNTYDLSEVLENGQYITVTRKGDN